MTNELTASMMPIPTERPRVRLFGIAIDPLTMSETVDKVLNWAREPRGSNCRFVVTPNVDHAVMYQTNDKLRSAYSEASLVLADGAPVVAAARMLRRAIPERVPGSDLAPAMFKQVAKSLAEGGASTALPLRVFLLGAGPGVAERAAANIAARWPGVDVVGTLSPPMGFERDANENERILKAVAESAPDVLLVGFGAPKQELWVHAHAAQLNAKVALCIGATIDFLAGEKRRAPRWMRRVGLEWLHRLSTEPKRLAKRYLRDAWVFPQLVWRDWRGC
jgi:N-acetylglucosaminyldiphosphoundecaprenol N-acetyl-beta-D-mannosaminyltransferase